MWAGAHTHSVIPSVCLRDEQKASVSRPSSQIRNPSSSLPLRSIPAFKAHQEKRFCVGSKRVAQRGGACYATVSPASEQKPQEQPPKEEEIEVDSVDVLKIQKNVTLLRGVCSQRLKYEIEYSRKRGTTDNSYIVKDGKKAILIDIPDAAFAEKYVKAVSSAISLPDISDLVITHLTPRRVTTLKKLLESRKGGEQLRIYLSNPGIQSLRSILGKEDGGSELLSSVDLKVARSGDVVTIGKEQELKLIPTPTPRWPDLVCAYNSSSRLLFTSKLFSAHVCPSAVNSDPKSAFDVKGWETYEQDWHYFYDCMLAPVARQASGALERLKVISAPVFSTMSVMDALRAGLRTAQQALEDGQSGTFGKFNMGLSNQSAMVVTAICPMHGPVIKSSANEIIYKYREWTNTQIQQSQTCNVAVMYASAYGNTASLAQAISRGITKAGVGVETINLENADIEEVNEAIAKSSGFVIGSPTLGGHMPTQVATALGAVMRNDKAKSQRCGVFGSFGWSGEAVDELDKRLKVNETGQEAYEKGSKYGMIMQDAGFQFGFETIRVKFKPSAKDMQKAEESGTDLAQALLKQRRKEEKQSVSQPKNQSASETERAVGRLIGSLCAITAKDEEAESAMLASWISQASFDPPGLTVAVKKDRAVENLMGSGSKFVVNILAEGNHKKLMGQLLKPFKPGENRFEGLDISESEGNKGVVLPGAASYVDCTVQNRLDAGDHYIVYGTVDFGKVVDNGAVSAVHHRKVGTSY